MNTRKRYSPEFRDKAVRLVEEQQKEGSSEWATIQSLSEKLGCVPETVIRWHRKGFRRFWTRKCAKHGRPTINPKIKALIREMCRTNPLWGAPRIHGELLKLGLDVSEATVSRYMIRCPKPPSQTWRTFLENHAGEFLAADFFTVPTVRFRVLFVLVILSHVAFRCETVTSRICGTGDRDNSAGIH